MDNKPYTLDRIFRIFLVVLGLSIGLYLLNRLTDVFTPFLLAFLLAYLIDPMVSWVQRKIPSRGFAVALVLLMLSICLSAFLWWVLPLIGRELAHLGNLLKDLFTDSPLATRAATWLPNDLWAFLRRQVRQDHLQALFKNPDLLSKVQGVLSKMLPGAAGILSGTMNLLFALMGLVVVLLYLVFMLLDFQALKEQWESLIPERYREKTLKFVGDFDSAMNQYFRAQAFVASIVGVLFAIGFSIIGLPLALLLGLLLGLMNMVPYLQIVGLLPAGILAVIHALELGISPWSVLGWTALVFVVVQIIQDAFLVPKIMGKVTGLSPAMILLSISVWGQLLGFVGLIIALPLTCLLLAWYKGWQES